MRIGGIELPDGAALAPMAGITDMPMRILCFEQGAAWAVSEMLSARGFLCAPKGTRAMSELLRRSEREGILGLQLFGREPDEMREAASRLSEAGFQFIDINMGCPAHKIVSNGEGSALMKTPEKAEKIIAETVKGASIPVTVKIRAGWDQDHVNAVEIARRAEQAGASAVTVHGRTREQMYMGRADWDVIARVKAAVSIPVIGNGDVRSAGDFLAMRRETGCDGVAIGRGAQGNPWVFREIRAALRGETCPPPTLDERIDLALRHARMQAEYVGERVGIREMRKHAAWYMQGLPGCARLREAINRAQSYDDMERIMKDYAEGRERNGGKQIPTEG